MVIDIQVEDRFKGPLDLLLHLIKRDEIDIHDIPIHYITEEYLKVIGEMEALDVQVGADFVNMASMLMEIKSRMLLPPEEVEEDDETLEIDPRADLVEALLEYKRFKEAAGELESLYEVARSRFPRIGAPPPPPEASADEEPIDADLDQLYFAFLKLAEELSATEAGTIVTTEISTEETMEKMVARLGAEPRVSFRSFFGRQTTRHEMVVYFMAMLELVRLKRIRAFQADAFGEIYVEAIPDEPQLLRLPAHRLPRGGSGGMRARPILRLLVPGTARTAPVLVRPVAPFLPLGGERTCSQPIDTPLSMTFLAIPQGARLPEARGALSCPTTFPGAVPVVCTKKRTRPRPGTAADGALAVPSGCACRPPAPEALAVDPDAPMEADAPARGFPVALAPQDEPLPRVFPDRSTGRSVRGVQPFLCDPTLAVAPASRRSAASRPVPVPVLFGKSAPRPAEHCDRTPTHGPSVFPAVATIPARRRRR